MQVATLNKCISEAESFLSMAKNVPVRDLPAELNVRSTDMSYIESGKASGALKRKSMDLTRALADLRQNR